MAYNIIKNESFDGLNGKPKQETLQLTSIYPGGGNHSILKIVSATIGPVIMSCNKNKISKL